MPVNIHAVCIDSGGHFTQAVFDFCEHRRVHRVWALAAIHGLASHGVSPDVEADRVALLRQNPQAAPSNQYQIYRSGFLTR